MRNNTKIFMGTLGSLLFLEIIGGLACAFTVGIALPWVINASIRYVVNNIVINNYRFSFNATFVDTAKYLVKTILLSLTIIYILFIPQKFWSFVVQHIEVNVVSN